MSSQPKIIIVLIGREKGEKKKAEEIAKKARQKGTPIEFIVEITGLSKEEIEEL